MIDPPDPRNPAPSPGQRRPPLLRALISIRFFAAFHVLLYHFFPNYRDQGILSWLVGSGYTGVSFFFVLSGFILVYSHADEYLSGRGSAKRFYFARFARVYPIYLGALLITFVLEWRLLLKPLHLLAVAADLLIIQSWSVKTAILFLAPAWTLSCEAFFYLTFPFLILRLRPNSALRAAAAIMVLWLTSQIVPIWYLHHIFGFQLQQWLPEQASSLLNLVQFNPVFALPEFLCGMLLGWIAVCFPISAATTSTLACSGLIAVGAGILSSRHLPYAMLHNGLLIPAYAVLILGLTQKNLASRILAVKPLVLLGESSFALYLYHWFFAWYMPAGSPWSSLAKVALMLPLSVAVHLCLERPARRGLLRWWNARNIAPPKAAGSW